MSAASIRTVSTMPHQIGSQPSSNTIGAMNGVVRIIMEIVSMKQPSTR